MPADDELLLFEPGWIFHVNSRNDPFFYKFDYDIRSKNESMQFQHFHLYYEIFICLDSECDHLLGASHYRAEPYDIVCIKPSMLHRANYLNCESAKRIVVQFLLDELPSPLYNEYRRLLTVFDSEVPVFRFPRETLEQLFAPLNDLVRVHRQQIGPTSLYAHIKFTEFLLMLNHMQKENSFFAGTPVAVTSRVHEITSYILKHYNEDLTLEKLSDRFHLSPYYLSHLIKAETGYTLTSNIQLTRVRNAQKMLVFTDLHIAEIAEKCGFTSFSQFNRTFTKFIGLSPSLYRKQAAERGERSVRTAYGESYRTVQPRIPPEKNTKSKTKT